MSLCLSSHASLFTKTTLDECQPIIILKPENPLNPNLYYDKSPTAPGRGTLCYQPLCWADEE